MEIVIGCHHTPHIHTLSLTHTHTHTHTHTQDREDPFYVVDLGRLLELHEDWTEALPTIQPFYAVKCNNDPALLKTLAALGTGFDCASKV